MNKITLFVLAVICFEVAYSRRTYSVKKSSSEAENIFAPFTDSDTDVASPVKSRKPIAKTPSLPPSPKSKKPIEKSKSATLKNAPTTADSVKKNIDEKTLYVTPNTVVKGNKNGEITINGVLAYVDEKLKQGLVRLENIDGDLYVNGNVVIKKNPSKPKIRIAQPKLDTDQVKQFTIKIGKSNGFNNIGNNNIGNVSISGSNISGINSNGNTYGSVQYEDNINGKMTFF